MLNSSSGSGSISLDGVLPAVSRADADKFTHVWYGGLVGHVVLTRISSAGRHIVKSVALPAGGMSYLINEAEDFDTLCADDGGTWNVYVSCSLHSVDPTAGGSRRGGKSTVGFVHGVWLDLDVKDESFSSAREIDAFLDRLGVAPTLVVDSGSGGRHAYWRFSDGVLSVEDGERANEAWWAWASEVAGDGVFIDRVSTADRIMRLPGTLRWPKGNEGVGRVLVVREGLRVSVEQLWAVSSGAWERLRARRAEKRSAMLEAAALSTQRLGELARSVGWDQLLALAHVEDVFNENTSWDAVLVPHGWRMVGTDNEGRRHWARPGQRGKSAHTDYPLSPHVMKLFSNARETGLSDLLDAEVPLTKFRVHAALAYGGDTAALVEALLAAAAAGEEDLL